MPEQKPIAVTLAGSPQRTAERFRQLFPNATPEQVVRAAGVVDGMQAHLEAVGDSLKVTGYHSDGESRVAAYYHPAGDLGDKEIHQEISWNVFGPQHRGQGYQRFADQLEALDKLPQVTKIVVPDAAGVAGSRMFNGYATWPRFGFNAPLTTEHRYLLSPELDEQLGPNADFHKLYAHPNGPAEWKANGKAITDMEFDLSPDSEHRKRFRAYYEHRKQKAAGDLGASGASVRSAVPAVPPPAAQEAAHPYRTASRVAKVAETLGVRNRLKNLFRYASSRRVEAVQRAADQIPVTEDFTDEPQEGKWTLGEQGHHLAFSTSTGKFVATVTHSDSGLPRQFGFADELGQVGVTGAGSAHSVFSKVVPAFVSYLKNVKPEAVQFTASEKSRKALYDHLAAHLKDTNPEYDLFSEDKGVTKAYTLRRKGEDYCSGAEAFKYKQQETRSGVLLPIEGPVRDQILSLANRIPDHLLTGNGRETDPHLTLLYGLHHPDPEAVRQLFSKAEGKIGFRLGKISVFKNPDFDVVKLEVHSPDAHRANALLKTLPHTSNFPTYNPHITLGYVKSGEGEAIAKQLGEVEGQGESDKIIFSDPDRNHTHLPIGETKEQYRRGAKVLKYNTEAEAHPSVKGFQLEYALRRAISDPSTTSELKALSHTLLTKGVERSDAAYGINDEVQSLPEDHWLRKAGYNWMAVPHRLHLDAAVGHAIEAVNRSYGETPQHPYGAESLEFHINRPEDLSFGTHSVDAAVSREAADLLLSQHSPEDLRQSLRRHRNRRLDQVALRNGHVDKETLTQQASASPAQTFDEADRYAAKGKNPEGGLTVAEARRQGIRAGSETAAEAKKAGGFSKIEGKTQKRRKSFCARACGQAKQFPKAAKDPKSRLRLALKQWGCRCPSKNTAEEQAEKYAEEKPNYSPLISHAAAVLDNPLNDGAVNSFLDHLQEQHPDDKGVQQFAEWAQGGDPVALKDLYKEVLHDARGNTEDGSVQLNFQPRPHFDNFKDAHLIFKSRQGSWLRGKKDASDFEWDGTEPLTTAEVAQHLYDKGGPANLAFAVMAARHFSPERQAERKLGKRNKLPTYYQAEKVKYQSPALSEFITAVRQIRSDNQEVRRKIAEEQYKKLGLEAKVRDAIADWPHSASANTAHSVDHNGDLDKVRAGAALYGIQTNSPQLLLFHEHPEGADLLHKFDAQGSAEKLRQQLDAAGLPERTLSPTPTGWSVFFFDPKGQLQPKLSAFTQQAGYNLETSVGTGERIGDGQQAEADRGNRADYRKFIRQFEKQQGIQ